MPSLPPPPPDPQANPSAATPAGPPPSGAKAPGPDGTWVAFLAITIAMVGLCGLFATYSAPLPLERAMAREVALDDALRAAHGPDPAVALAALAPRLDDSASAILPLGPDIDARIAAERVAMRARLTEEADATALRLRWLVCMMTLMGGVFGIAILNIAARANRS